VSALRGAALRYAAYGWRVLACKPDNKQPATPHGVRDATNDFDQICKWWRRWPEANVAIACGAPGPQVLDIDDLDGFREATTPQLRAELDQAPTVCTPRGRHHYFAGTNASTIKLPFGELRGRGSYVLVPPSTVDARVYTATNGGPLLAVPAGLGEGRRSLGAGVQQVPPSRIAAGQGRDIHMEDAAIRMVRAGFLDHRRLVAHLKLEFGLSCEPDPPPARHDYFEQLAARVLKTDIAKREAELAELARLIRTRRAGRR
jgi:hypothetical protein